MIFLRALWGIIFFLLVEVIVFLPLYLVGLVAFPLAFHFASRKLVESRINSGEYIVAFQNPILNEWLGNHEDGLTPTWWQKARNGTAYGWFLRNPVCNMRFWPIVSTLPEPDKVGWVGSLDFVPSDPIDTGWFFCWQGWYSGFYYQNKSWGCWVGWKTSPRDRRYGKLGGPAKDYRFWGLGTVLQVFSNK